VKKQRRALIGLMFEGLGGWSSYAQNLAALLREEGYRVDFIVDFSTSDNEFKQKSPDSYKKYYINRTFQSRSFAIQKISAQIRNEGFYDLGLNVSSQYANEIFDSLGICKTITTLHSIVPY